MKKFLMGLNSDVITDIDLFKIKLKGNKIPKNNVGMFSIWF